MGKKHRNRLAALEAQFASLTAALDRSTEATTQLTAVLNAGEGGELSEVQFSSTAIHSYVSDSPAPLIPLAADLPFSTDAPAADGLTAPLSPPLSGDGSAAALPELTPEASHDEESRQ